MPSSAGPAAGLILSASASAPEPGAPPSTAATRSPLFILAISWATTWLGAKGLPASSVAPAEEVSPAARFAKSDTPLDEPGTLPCPPPLPPIVPGPSVKG